MSNTAPITLEQLFRFWRALPHQQASIAELEADLRENGYAVAMKRDRAWFATWSQAGKQEDDAWLAPALEIIKRWEGCRLEAYPDPGTGGEPWTIGYGITRIAGQPVRPGQKITQSEADSLLEAEVRAKGQQVLGLLPMAAQWRPNQVAALVSWAYNVGASAVEGSTLRKRLLAGEDPGKVVAEELKRWNKGGSGVMEGLVRRRADEVRLFGAPKLELPAQQPGRVTPSSPFDTRLTAHVQVGEFALFQEARRFQHQHQVDTAAELAAFLERVRSAFGGKPVIITSGYRPPAVNRSVGGASSSEHLYDAPGVGAVDFYIKGADINAVQAWCDREWSFSLGYGAPKGFVHLGIRSGRPRVRWDY